MNHANDAYCTICKKTTPHDAPHPGQPRKCILCGRHEVKANPNGGQMLYRMIKPLEEGDEVQYVGNYVLRQNERPSVGFVEAVEESELVAALRLALPIVEYVVQSDWGEPPSILYPHDEHEALEAVEAALAKAKGENDE